MVAQQSHLTGTKPSFTVYLPNSPLANIEILVYAENKWGESPPKRYEVQLKAREEGSETLVSPEKLYRVSETEKSISIGWPETEEKNIYTTKYILQKKN